MSKLDYQLFYRRHLPHVQPPGATLFVTFRLAGSIPRAMLERLFDEQKRVAALIDNIGDPEERFKRADAERRKMFGKWDRALDNAQEGPQWLRDRRIATSVARSLHFLNSRKYELDAYCVMPNHVHVVYRPLAKDDETCHSMSSIMYSLKRRTAQKANAILEQGGTFWQHENYDHVVRDEAEWRRIVKYVLNNPVAAGLVSRPDDWEWSYCKHL